VGSVESLCTLGARLPSTSRVADYYSVEDLRLQLLDREDVTLLQGSAVWSTWLLCTLGKQCGGAAWRAAGYNFPLLSVESDVLVLWSGTGNSPAVRDSSECWTSKICRERSLLVLPE
jgi:hypothetical protein